MGQAVPKEDIAEPPAQTSKSPWVLWYDIFMAILEEDVTTEKKLAAIEKSTSGGKVEGCK